MSGPLSGALLAIDADTWASLRVLMRAGVANQRASIECRLRTKSPHLGFALFAGLDPLMEQLETLRMDEADTEFLRGAGLFEGTDAARVGPLAFQCDVAAAAEGTVVFPGDALVTIDGPLWQAQLVANLACRILGDATLSATRTARLRSVAPSLDLLDVGGARSLSVTTGASRARACYLAGATATTSLSAHHTYHVPLRARQTDLARSWSSSGRDSRFYWVQHAPKESMLRFEGGREAAAELAEALSAGPFASDPTSIEVSFEQFTEAEAVLAAQFEKAHLPPPMLYVGDSVDELLIRELAAESNLLAGVCIDPGEGADLLSLSSELVAIEEEGRWAPRMSALGSLAQSSDPGKKLLVRYVDAAGVPVADVAHATSERMQPPSSFELVLRSSGRRMALSAAKADPLLSFVMRGGRRTSESRPLIELRGRAERELERIAAPYRRLHRPASYPVGLSLSLHEEKVKRYGARP
ncbi:MAG: hypothetical protein U0174_13445 [Polyangiaceae bacterium]